MREIGGYIELDTYKQPMLHEGAIALNCGRSALAYVIKAKGVRSILMPRFICDSVPKLCVREGVEVRYYSTGLDLKPADEIRLKADEWLLLVNYYGQLTDDEIRGYRDRYKRVMLDQAQSYFQMPVERVDTFYSCRKYFGVADGAFLYTDALLGEDLPQDESYERMNFLLGRFERPASEFHSAYAANNAFFAGEPIKKMSKLTLNLLHGIDYKEAEKIRTGNFERLHAELKEINGLDLRLTGTFMYPLLIKNGAEIRKRMQAEKIFVPLLWPSVLKNETEESPDRYLADNILPLPIDQRYGPDDMDYMIEKIIKMIG